MKTPLWWITLDGDLTGFEMYQRHYSSRKSRGKQKRRLFVGPGTKRVFRTWEGDAYFVWRDFIDDSGQEGICCSVFRNESTYRSSDLIRQALRIADALWPGRRLYTQIDASAVQSRNPGYCFLVSGFRRCGVTKDGLVVLEYFSNSAGAGDGVYRDDPASDGSALNEVDEESLSNLGHVFRPSCQQTPTEAAKLSTETKSLFSDAPLRGAA